MQKGSMTIFFSMLVVTLGSLFFSMSAVVRLVEMKNRSLVVTQEALQNTLSEYQPYLWEQYEILALDENYGAAEEKIGAKEVSMVQERVADFCWENAYGDVEREEKGVDFFRLQVVSCQMTGCERLTDNQGAWFRRQAVQAAKKQISQEALEQWMSKKETAENISAEEGEVEQKVMSAKEAMEAEKEESSKDKQDEKESETEKKEISIAYENPFSVFQLVKEQGVVGLITGNGDISEKSISLEGCVSHRKRCAEESVKKEGQEEKAADMLWYSWYLLHNFNSYTKKKGDRVLDYEMEYLVTGKNSDRENLESVLKKLLAMREGQNLITILSNPDMVQKSKSLSLAMAGASANPVVVEAVQTAIVAVWALVESILDVRTLVQGGSISVWKSRQEWVSDLYTLGNYLAPSCRAVEKENGISYQHYLVVFLMAQEKNALGLRPLDLIEKQLQQQEGGESVRMDHFLCAIRFRAAYQGKPLFLGYVTSVPQKEDWYYYEVEKEMTY